MFIINIVKISTTLLREEKDVASCKEVVHSCTPWQRLLSESAKVAKRRRQAHMYLCEKSA
jgi:hypothetical protein